MKPSFLSCAVMLLSFLFCLPETGSGRQNPTGAPMSAATTEGATNATTANPAPAVPISTPAEKNRPQAAEDSPPAPVSGLKQFGYDLFEKAPSTFAPVQHVPVGPEYVVGPGDTIKVEIWGKIDGSWSVTVDNDGNMSLPKVGVFGVTGLTFGQLKELIHKKLSRLYTGFEMNVAMGSLRSMRVYLVGNVKQPGAYTVSSLSTVINALFEGGGPSRTGSMRDIQVKRNGTTVVSFDLYDFLLRGDKTKDLRLMPEDVIFVPPIGPLAGIAGHVKTPALYEMKGETRLLDLIGMAGGLTGTAFTGRVQVQRIQEHQFRTLFEGDLLDVEKIATKNFPLQDGDLVRVFPVTDSATTVTVSGAVAAPGEYAVEPGVTRVGELLSLAGGLRYYASERAEVTRITVTQNGPKTDIFMIDLGKALAGDREHNVALQRDDHLFVRTVPEWKATRTVTVDGEVRFPGTYTIAKGETLSSVLERAGGLTDRAYPRGLVFTREKVREMQQKQIDEMAERLQRELIGSGISQMAGATSPDDARMVQLELEQKRHFVAQLKAARAKGRIALNVRDLASLKDSTYDIELDQGDHISIPANPKTVQVIGSVYNQSTFVYEPAEAFDYYVELAGGYMANADRRNAYILQANGTAIKAGGTFLGFGDRLNSGDTIVVPEKLERVTWMRDIKDITQIIFQIAMTAGVLIQVF